MSNTAWGEMVVMGPAPNVLSFFLSAIESPVVMHDRVDLGRYSVYYDSPNPHIAGSDRCFIPQRCITISTVKGDATDLLTAEVYSECSLECAWDVDAGALKELSDKFKIRIEAEIEETGEGFRHIVAFDRGVVVSDFTEELEG